MAVDLVHIYLDDIRFRLRKLDECAESKDPDIEKNREKFKENLEENIKDQLDKICKYTIKDDFYQNSMYGYVEEKFPEKHKQNFHKRYTEHAKEKRDQKTIKRTVQLTACILVMLGSIIYTSDQTMQLIDFFNENKIDTTTPQAKEINAIPADSLKLKTAKDTLNL